MHKEAHPLTLSPSSTTSKGKLAGVSIDRHRLDELATKGTISAETRQMSLDWLHPSYLWANWAMLLLLAFGTGLILSGIIFFFAFNWASIPDLVKLAAIQGVLILTVLGAWWYPSGRLTGQLLLLASSILVGVFLATFGQVYQTGADAWQLFALWALLITPWTFVSRSAVLWAICLGLINLAYWLFWKNTAAPREQFAYLFNLSHVLIFGLALLAREILLRREKPEERAYAWLALHWTRWLLVAAMLLFLFPNLLEWISDPESADAVVTVSGIMAAILTAALFVTYRKFSIDIPALAMILLMLCVLIVFALATFLDAYVLGDLGTTFWTAVAAISCFAAAAGYLRKLLSQEELQQSDRNGQGTDGHA